MFLASLVVASKFVQDKTYRNSAWAKIAGLPISEINMAERCFLQLLDYQLYIDQITFDSWHRQLHRHSQAHMEGLPISIHDLDYLSFTPPSPPSPIIEYNNTSMYRSDSPCPPPSLSASSSISSSPALTPPLASKRKLETIESFMNKKHCRLWQ
jgi:hypothetical protein